jgi:hypothetical protein
LIILIFTIIFFLIDVLNVSDASGKVAFSKSEKNTAKKKLQVQVETGILKSKNLILNRLISTLITTILLEAAQ